MAELSPTAPLLAGYGTFVRRHRVWFALLVVVGLCIGILLSMGAPSTWSATASVALTPVPKYVTNTTDQLAPPEVTIDTDAQLLRSPEVVGAVAEVLGVDATTATSRLGVTASPNSHVLHVTITADSPELAASAANAAVAALDRVRRDTLGTLRDDQVNQVRVLLASTEGQLARQQARRVVITSTDDLFADVLDLQAGLDELEEAQQHPTRVVTPATPPQRHDYANAEVPIVSGAALGLLSACLIGAARDRLLAVSRDARLTAHRFLSPGRAATLHEESHV